MYSVISLYVLAWFCVLVCTEPIPPGAILYYAGSSNPSGYLLCEGQQINASTYYALAQSLDGTPFVGDEGVITLPDLQGRSLRGVDSSNSLGTTKGAETHTLTFSEGPSHTHGIKASNGESTPVGQGGIFRNGARMYAPQTPNDYPIPLGDTIVPEGGGAPHNNMPPYLVLHTIICVANTGCSMPIGAIIAYVGESVPSSSWMTCAGDLVDIGTYPDLADLLSVDFGSNTPDLRGRVPITSGLGSGLITSRAISQTGGEEKVALHHYTMPHHTHTFVALNVVSNTAEPANNILTSARWRTGQQAGSIYGMRDSSPIVPFATTTEAGAGQPHENMSPFLVTNYIICANNDCIIDGKLPLGAIMISASNSFGSNGWAPANGTESTNPDLNALLGPNYLDSETETYFLPNFEMRMGVGAGTGNLTETVLLTTRVLGEIGGEESVVLTENNLPMHNHDVQGLSSTGTIAVPVVGCMLAQAPSGAPALQFRPYAPEHTYTQQNLHQSTVGSGGNSQPHNNMEPTAFMNFFIAVNEDNSMWASAEEPINNECPEGYKLWDAFTPSNPACIPNNCSVSTACSTQQKDYPVVNTDPESISFKDNQLIVSVIGPFVSNRTYTNITFLNATGIKCWSSPDSYWSRVVNANICKDQFQLTLPWEDHTTCGFVVDNSVSDPDLVQYKGTIELSYMDDVGEIVGVRLTRSTVVTFDVYIGFPQSITLSVHNVKVTSQVNLQMALTEYHYNTTTKELGLGLTTILPWPTMLISDYGVNTTVTPSHVQTIGVPTLLTTSAKCPNTPNSPCLQKIDLTHHLVEQACDFNGEYSLSTTVVTCRENGGNGCTNGNITINFSIQGSSICNTVGVKPTLHGVLLPVLPDLETQKTDFVAGEIGHFITLYNSSNTVSMVYQDISVEDTSGTSEVRFLLQGGVRTGLGEAVQLEVDNYNNAFSVQFSALAFNVPPKENKFFIIRAMTGVIFLGNKRDVNSPNMISSSTSIMVSSKESQLSKSNNNGNGFHSNHNTFQANVKTNSHTNLQTTTFSILSVGGCIIIILLATWFIYKTKTRL